MKNISFQICAFLVFCLSIDVVMPSNAQARDFFRGISSQKVRTQSVEVRRVQTEEEKTFTRNQKIVGTMRAFRQSPPELKNVVATILTNDECNMLANLDLPNLQSYKTLRANLKDSGLKEIQSSIARARGTKFKTALTTLLVALVHDNKVDPSIRNVLISQLQGISLMPYRFQDLHQFAAFMALKDLLNETEMKSFSNAFVRAHSIGKDNKLQLAVYGEALKQMRDSSEVPLQLKVGATRPSISISSDWNAFTILATGGEPMTTYGGEVEVPEMVAPPAYEGEEAAGSPSRDEPAPLYEIPEMEAPPGSGPGEPPTYAPEDELDPTSPEYLGPDTEPKLEVPESPVPPGYYDPYPPWEGVKYLGPDGIYYDNYFDYYRAVQRYLAALEQEKRALEVLCAVFGGDYCVQLYRLQ